MTNPNWKQQRYSSTGEGTSTAVLFLSMPIHLECMDCRHKHWAYITDVFLTLHFHSINDQIGAWVCLYQSLQVVWCESIPEKCTRPHDADGKGEWQCSTLGDIKQVSHLYNLLTSGKSLAQRLSVCPCSVNATPVHMALTQSGRHQGAMCPLGPAASLFPPM